MRILDKAVYVGPSLYAHFPVIRLDVDLGELEEWPSVKLGRGFTDGLVAALPGLKEHGCSYGKPGGFIRRLTEDEGTWMGHILEHVAIELQNVAGEPVTFGKTRSHGASGHYHVIYQYEQEDVGVEAGRLGAHAAPLAAARPSCGPRARCPADFDFAAERDEFIRYAQRRHLGPSTMSLVRAAEERKIPWIRLNEQSLIQFGHGRYQQRIQATVTSRTSHIAVELASDKEETNRILGNLGLPVPRQRLVQGEDDAVEAAERIGYPVVVKPFNANHGRGITIHITTPDEVRAAFEVAREHSRSVIVESFITGEDHRMLVIDGRLIAVSKRVPGHVVGDGVHTIEQLVEEVNQDPRRGIGHEKVLTRLTFDHQAETMLERKGYTRETVPAGGRAGLPPLHRQPLDRRHRHRSHRRGASRQRRDGDPRGEGDRARRGRGGLPLHRHHRVLQGSGRRDLRDQRRARVPDAHGAERGPRARRGRAGDGHALPARHAEPDPDRGGDRHQRQDHHGPDAGPHPQAGRPSRRAHLDRRGVHRRPAHASPAT